MQDLERRRSRALLAALAVAAALAAAGPTPAQGREFAGTVISKSGSSLVVEDRRGERVSFARDKDTVVEGKGGWSALTAGDRVLVKWSLTDGPRRAHRVIVLGAGRER